jgi:hypothetical protein
MKNRIHRHLSVEELHALELAAHRARSFEFLRLISAPGLKALIERVTAAAHGGGKVGHA